MPLDYVYLITLHKKIDKVNTPTPPSTPSSAPRQPLRDLAATHAIGAHRRPGRASPPRQNSPPHPPPRLPELAASVRARHLHCGLRCPGGGLGLRRRGGSLGRGGTSDEALVARRDWRQGRASQGLEGWRRLKGRRRT
jgi:hypothetical protein